MKNENEKSIKEAGNCLRAFRTVHDLTIREISETTGIGSSHISEMETNKKSLTPASAEKYDIAFGLKPGTVFASVQIMQGQPFQECLRMVVGIWKINHKPEKHRKGGQSHV